MLRPIHAAFFLLFLLVSSVFPLDSFGQSWIHNFTDLHIEYVKETDEGGYILLGRAKTSIGYSLKLIKVSETGEIQWEKMIPPELLSSAYLTYMFVDSDQNYVISQNDHRSSHNILKFSSQGEFLFRNDDTSIEYARRGLESSDRHYYFVGEGDGYEGDVYTWYMVLNKTNTDLEVIQTTKVPLPQIENSKYLINNFRLIELSDGSVLALCHTEFYDYGDSEYKNSVLLSRISESGDILFQENIVLEGTIYDVIDQKDGAFLLSGVVPNPKDSSNSIFIQKRTYDNEEVWTRRETVPGVNGYSSIIPVAGNKYAAYGTSTAEYDYFRILDAEGRVENEFSTAGIHGISKNLQISLVEQTADGGYIAFDVLRYDKAGSSRFHKLDSQFKLQTHLIAGNVFYDLNKNCQKDEEDSLPVSAFIRVEPGNILTRPDAEGNFSVAVNPGAYSLEQVLTEEARYGAKPLCPSDGKVELTLSDTAPDTARVSFANEAMLCHALKVSVSSSRRRRCFPGQTYIDFKNLGFAAASNVELFVEFPEYIVPTSMPDGWEALSSRVYRLSISDVQAGEHQKMVIPDSVVCGNEAIRGLTQCVKAWVTPASNCLEESADWDRSSIAVTGQCQQNENLRFVIKNAGSGNMEVPQAYRIFQHDTLVHSSNFQLASGDSLVLTIPALGNTLRLEADQHSQHPGNSRPRVTIEACGAENGDSVFPGITSNAPLDDEDLEVAISCLRIVDSYDPNDKAVIPAGITAEHFVKPGSRLHYTIRFQNTGTDTAYTVVLKDTLSRHLDYSTFAMLSSSHDYKLEVNGEGEAILTFRFNQINLPDSTVDEPGSNGFVAFSIKPYDITPLNTRIENTAHIFFDYNSAIVTNTTLSTLSDFTPEAATPDPFPLEEAYYPAIPELSEPALNQICEGDPQGIILEAPSGYTYYEWSNGSTDKNLVVSQAGDYAVRVGNTPGIWSAYSQPVHISAYETPEIPQISASQETAFCVGESITLSAPEGFSQYEWSNGATTREIEVQEPGTYSLKVANALGCWSQASEGLSIQISEVPATPRISLLTAAEICAGETAMLSTPDGYMAYEWSNGATEKEIAVAENGEYKVKVSNAAGCWSDWSAPQQVISSEKANTPDWSLSGKLLNKCVGESITLSAPAGYFAYEWSNGVSAQIIEVSNTGFYAFRVAEEASCWSDYSKGIQVIFNPAPTATIEQDGMKLKASEGSAYTWYLNGEKLDNASQQIEVEQTGDYQVMVQSQYGCSSLPETVSVILSAVEEHINDISLFPNPTAGEIFIQSASPIKSIRIIKSDGTKVLQKEVGTTSCSYNLSEFGAGVFLVQLVFDSKVLVYKVIRF